MVVPISNPPFMLSDLQAVRSKLDCWRLDDSSREEILSGALEAYAARIRREKINDPHRWIMRAASLGMRNCLRRRNSARLFYDDNKFANRSAPDDAPKQASTQAIHDAIRKLPPRQRQLIDLHIFRGLTVAASARELGICPKNASNQLQKAYLLLRCDVSLLEAVEP